jgi:acyl carrier protein
MTMNAVHQEEIFASVCDVLREVLHLADETITPDDELDLLENADSVRLMQAVSQLERRFDVEFADDAIRDARTVTDLTELISAELAAGGGAA